jgi:hypothetical protein
VSTALAIAGVTATLRALLENAFARHDLSGTLGAEFKTTTSPPDRLNEEPSKARLNVFLRQVSPNAAFRNHGLPAWDPAGRSRTSNPPLALNLHYLLSAHAVEEYLPEILLGHAMHALHEHPLLTRNDLLEALTSGSASNPVELALAGSRLEEQVESLRISPEFLSTEEMSKFWAATLVHYRPCAAYVVSLVLIQASEPTRNPLPVLERRLAVNPDLFLVPTLTEVVPGDREPAALPGTTVTLVGHRLGGTGQKVVLENDRLEIEAEFDVGTTGDGTLDFEVPGASAASLPVGVYRVFARVPGSDGVRETNRLALTLAPKITKINPPSVDASGNVNFNVEFLPALRAGQRVSLFVGHREYVSGPLIVDPADPRTDLDFSVNEPAGAYLLRLRVDGIDSPIVHRLDTPTFRDLRLVIA